VNGFSSLAAFLLTAALATAQTQMPEDTSAGIPKFYAQSRQILIAATVWDSSRTDTSWVPQDVLNKNPVNQRLFAMHPPVQGLAAKSFHVFDNGSEQPVNYFREADSPGVNLTGEWLLVPNTLGTWGFSSNNAAVSLNRPKATYLIGYAPPALRPGECRTIRVVAGSYTVQLNRQRYCAAKATDSIDDSLRATDLGSQMRSTSASRKKGTIKVSLQAFTFWSSGVLSLIQQAPLHADASAEPTAEYKYVVEVRDAAASATVQIAVGFPGLENWPSNCPANPAIHLLGVVYKSSGEFVREFGNSYPCHILTKSELPGLTASDLQHTTVQVPGRFDTQVELVPGEYELHVVISDGRNFGHVWTPLHVEPLAPPSLTISDLVPAGIVRSSNWVLMEAASLTPSPILPNPLVSKDSQFFPDSDAATQLRNRAPLYLYFQIYKSQLAPEAVDVYCQWRITKKKTGSVVMSGDRISAADWVVPGNAVIPIGLKLDTETLKKGDYQVEVQASDSAGHQTEWRKAEFVIE
jgi:hypothetical protein